MSVIATALYIFWQCTWGVLQSLIGLILFLRDIKKPHFMYRGAVITRWRGGNSVSLGMFAFVTERADGEQAERILVHEYGHTIQSLLLGPLYLLVIGLPSLIWCNARPLQRRRRRRGIPYSAFYPERWANRLGERATGKKAL